MNATWLKCLVVGAALVPVTGSATAFLVQNERPTCHGLFDIKNFTYDCGNRCTFGASIDLAGSRKPPTVESFVASLSFSYIRIFPQFILAVDSRQSKI